MVRVKPKVKVVQRKIKIKVKVVKVVKLIKTIKVAKRRRSQNLKKEESTKKACAEFMPNGRTMPTSALPLGHVK